MQEATSKLQSASGSGSSAGAKRPAAELRNGVDLCSSWRQRAAQYSSLRSPFLVSGLPFEAGSEDVREDTQFHVNHVWGRGETCVINAVRGLGAASSRDVVDPSPQTDCGQI